MPSAMMCAFYYVSGTFLGLREYILAPLGVPYQDSLILKDRAWAPNYGSGPYFIARKSQQEYIRNRYSRIIHTCGTYVGNDYNHYWSGLAYFFNTSNFTCVNCMKSGKNYQYFVEQWDLQPYQKNDTWWCKFMVRNTGWIIKSDLRPPLTEELAKSLIPAIEGVSWSVKWDQQMTNSKGGSVSSRCESFTPYGDLKFNFVNNEYHTFMSIADTGSYLNGSATRFQAAYSQAADSFADSSINTLGNAIELCESIKTITDAIKGPHQFFAKLIAEAKDPRKTWLAYRYSYSTTKMDIQEYKLLYSRLKTLSRMMDQDVHSTGNYSDETGSYKCELRVHLRDVFPQNLSEWLDKFGFSPTIGNTWDLIPYSFVVDWVLPISRVIEWFDSWTYSLTLSPREIWFTYVSSYDGQTVFYRVFGKRLSVPPQYVNKVASGKTWRMRIADAISLFT